MAKNYIKMAEDVLKKVPQQVTKGLYNLPTPQAVAKWATGPLPSGKPTQSAGKLTPELKARLSKEAPETLKPPRPWQFSSLKAYKEAGKKYETYGHWASNP